VEKCKEANEKRITQKRKIQGGDKRAKERILSVTGGGGEIPNFGNWTKVQKGWLNIRNMMRPGYDRGVVDGQGKKKERNLPEGD